MRTRNPVPSGCAAAQLIAILSRRAAAWLIAFALIGVAGCANGTTQTAPESSSLSSPSTSPITSVVARAPSRPSPARWEKDIAAFEAADRTAPPPRDAVLFVGSSTIRLWRTLADDFAGWPVINRGFGGSHLADSVYYADRIVIPYHPRAIVLFAGTNDINDGVMPEEVLADFQAFVTKVRAALPDVRIAYLSMAPCPARWSQRHRQIQANHLIRDYAKTATNVQYIEVWDQLLGPDGTPRADLYEADGLHPNREGYRIRAETIRRQLPR